MRAVDYETKSIHRVRISASNDKYVSHCHYKPLLLALLWLALFYRSFPLPNAE